MVEEMLTDVAPEIVDRLTQLPQRAPHLDLFMVHVVDLLPARIEQGFDARGRV